MYIYRRTTRELGKFENLGSSSTPVSALLDFCRLPRCILAKWINKYYGNFCDKFMSVFAHSRLHKWRHTDSIEARDPPIPLPIRCNWEAAANWASERDRERERGTEGARSTSIVPICSAYTYRRFLLPLSLSLLHSFALPPPLLLSA